jgi:hypothetical protein
MATLTFDGINDQIKINPLSTSINNIPNGAATIAFLLRVPDVDVTNYDVCGVRGGDLSGGYYHGIRYGSGAGAQDDYSDDDGIVGVQWSGTGASRTSGTTGDDFFISVLSYAAGTVNERIHASGKIGSAESWAHDDSNAANGGNRSGPGTSAGFFHIGNYDGAWFKGDIALVGIWAGTNFSDSDVEALWVNKNTSDWWTHSAGQPDTLIELNTSTPSDIGADPVSSISLSGPALTGQSPTGWTFDGRGAANPTFGLSSQFLDFDYSRG